MKRVYKYGTGDEIPEGAIYLSTQVQLPDPRNADHSIGWLVWHYFLVEVQDEQN